MNCLSYILNSSNIKIITQKNQFVGDNYIFTMYNSATNFLLEGRMKKLILLLLLAGFSHHTLAAGNVEKGKVKSYTCTGCHGIKFYMNVYPTYHVPRLGGQNEAYIVSALKAYRSGNRSHETMKVQAASLSDQDIADISAYFSSLK